MDKGAGVAIHSDRVPSEALNELTRLIREKRWANIDDDVDVRPDDAGGFRVTALSTRHAWANSGVEFHIKGDPSGSTITLHERRGGGLATSASEIERLIAKVWRDS
jgi:hypothetical protein